MRAWSARNAQELVRIADAVVCGEKGAGDVEVWV